MRAVASTLVLLTSACGAPHGASIDASTSDTARTIDGNDGGTTTLRIHYPSGAHTVTIRGSGGGLSWTAGQPTTTLGNVHSYSIAALSAPIEFKPLLDDTTWARGPNYHLVPGATVDLWPHFVATAGQVVTLIPSFHSATLANDRAIYAYLPPSYGENTDATYPVVYMHDGQNLWAALPQLAFSVPWNVDTTFDNAAEHGACSSPTVAGWGAQPLGAPPAICNGDADCGPGGSCVTFSEAIVIGVANSADRIYEYTPTTDPTVAGGGGADLYLKMLVQELKPAIDTQLRTRHDVASTALAGSSLGGLVSAYAGLKYPDVFSRIGELSPSTWWNNDVIVSDIRTTPPAPMRPTVVYVDSGQGTADGEADTDMLAQAYVGLGYVDGVQFRHVIQPGALHNEVYWGQRLPGALQLMLGAR
jgi:predicted alpha/beta superfamily hydrolase